MGAEAKCARSGCNTGSFDDNVGNCFSTACRDHLMGISGDDFHDTAQVQQSEGHAEVILKDQPFPSGRVVAKVPNGQTVSLESEAGEYVGVRWQGIQGFCRVANLKRFSASQSPAKASSSDEIFRIGPSGVQPQQELPKAIDSPAAAKCLNEYGNESWNGIRGRNFGSACHGRKCRHIGGYSAGAKCAHPGCSKLSFNGDAGDYCSSACWNSLRSLMSTSVEHFQAMVQVQQSEGYPEVVLKDQPHPSGNVVAKVPNGQLVTLLADGGAYARVRWLQIEGFCRGNNLKRQDVSWNVAHAALGVAHCFYEALKTR